MRVLYYTSNYGEGSLLHFQECRDELKRWDADVRIVMYSDDDYWDGELSVIKVEQTFAYEIGRRSCLDAIINSDVNSFDYIVYSENDTLIPAASFATFVEANEFLWGNYKLCSGFFRCEKDPQGRVFAIDARDADECKDIEMGGRHFTTFLNGEHQGGFAFNAEQVMHLRGTKAVDYALGTEQIERATTAWYYGEKGPASVHGIKKLLPSDKMSVASWHLQNKFYPWCGVRIL